MAGLRLNQLGGTFTWLLDHGVTSDRIAHLLGTTPVNIRVTASRWRNRQEPLGIDAASIVAPLPEVQRRAIGVRTHIDSVVLTKQKASRLDALHEAVCEVTRNCRNQYQFRGGIERLSALLPKAGFAADARRISWLATVHFQIAWFYSHLGESESSIRHARTSMKLWRVAWEESARPPCIDGFVKAALVASNNYLLYRLPTKALEILDLAKEAVEFAGKPLGSDHFRQRGVATFQLGQDRESQRYFDRAVVAMLERGEARTPATPLLTGPRHTALMGTPNWEGSLEIRESVRQFFSENSLEYSMSTNWTAACAFCTDAMHLWRAARQLLEGNAERASSFGHQATVTRLLLIVPDLGLYPRLARAFARRALYENAARSS